MASSHNRFRSKETPMAGTPERRYAAQAGGDPHLSAQGRAEAAFDALMADAAIPMLREFGMDVIAHGHSDHERETRFPIRAYADRADLEQQ